MIHINWAASGNSIYFLLLIPVLALLIYRWWYIKGVLKLLNENAQYSLVQHTSLLRVTIKTCIWFMALVFLLVVLLRPQWHKKEEVIPQEGRNVFIALDISRSMLAQDIKPNRLSFAKAKIKALIKALSSERVGLILFAGSPFVQCPLTADYNAFYMFLDQIDADTISSGATSLDRAIAKALETFKMVSQKRNRVVIIFTDGEDFSSNLAQLKKDAEKEGIIIFTVGVGTAEGAPIPLVDPLGNSLGHQKDKKGAIVISKLNEGILQTLAHDVGGNYVKATSDNRDIVALTAQLEKIEKEKFEDRKIAHEEDQYPLFLLVAFFLLALEWIL